MYIGTAKSASLGENIDSPVRKITCRSSMIGCVHTTRHGMTLLVAESGLGKIVAYLNK